MNQNETFYWQGLILIAAGVAIPAAMYFFALPPLALALVVVGLTAILLLWHAAVVRAYTGSENVLLARAPWVVLVAAIYLLAVAGAMYVVPLEQNNVYWYLLAIFLGVMVYGAYLPATLLFWIATPESLTRQVLSFKKTLPWSQIDWVYVKRRQVSQSAMSVIPVAKWTEETVFVEAGSKRRIVVVMRAPLVRANARPLLEAIQQRATQALFGFERFPTVVARRSGNLQPAPNAQFVANVPADPSPGRFDVALAAALGRGEVIPNGWLRFPLQPRKAWQNALSFTFLGLALLAGVGYLYLSGIFVFANFIPAAWETAQVTQLLLIAQSIVLAGFAIFFTWRGLWWFTPLRHLSDYFFLVTSQGFMEVKGAKAEGAAFADIRGVRLGGGDFGWRLVAALRSGRKLELDIGSNYGPGRELYAYVVSALNASRTIATPSHRQGGLGASFDLDVENDAG